MKRFVDTREADIGGRFAWFDTRVMVFETHSGAMEWDDWVEFEADFEGDDIERYRRLAPEWCFTPPLET